MLLGVSSRGPQRESHWQAGSLTKSALFATHGHSADSLTTVRVHQQLNLYDGVGILPS
jgi:hypothetical protein